MQTNIKAGNRVRYWRGTGSDTFLVVGRHGDKVAIMATHSMADMDKGECVFADAADLAVVP